jgi:hypothetical protein
MRPTLRHLTIPAVILTIMVGCDDLRPRADDGADGVSEPVDFGPTAAYERRFIFLGPGQRLPTALLLDFVALSDGHGLQRGVRARLADGTEWVRLMDEGWRMDGMRDPWRLVPHPPLALIVGDGDDLIGLVVRGDTEVRLEPGAPFAEHSPDRGTQLVLRRARLTVGADIVQGILLDAQLGRALDPTATRGREDDAEATPAARPGGEALLLGPDGLHLVFATTGSGRIAWINASGRDDVRRGAQLQAVGWDRTDDGTRTASTWRVLGGGLEGELEAEVWDGVDVVNVPTAEGIGYAIATGWVEIDGVRHEVYGLVRHVR